MVESLLRQSNVDAGAEEEKFNQIKSQYLDINDQEIQQMLQKFENIEGFIYSFSNSSTKHDSFVILQIWNKTIGESKFVFIDNIMEHSSLNLDANSKPNSFKTFIGESSIVLVNFTGNCIQAFYFSDTFSRTLHVEHTHKSKKTVLYERNHLFVFDANENHMLIVDFVKDVVLNRYLYVNSWKNNITLFIKLFTDELTSNLECFAQAPNISLFDEDEIKDYKIYRNHSNVALFKDTKIHFCFKKQFQLILLDTVCLEKTLKNVKNGHYQLRDAVGHENNMYMLYYCPSPVTWVVLCVDVRMRTVKDFVEFKPRRNRPFVTLHLQEDNLLIKEKKSDEIICFKILKSADRLTDLCLNSLKKHLSEKEYLESLPKNIRRKFKFKLLCNHHFWNMDS